MKGSREDLELLLTLLMNFHSLDSAKVMECCYQEEGNESWKLLHTICFQKEEVPGTGRRAAASIADELTPVGLLSNMPSVCCSVSGTEVAGVKTKNNNRVEDSNSVKNGIIDSSGGGDCLLLSAALCDLKFLGLDMDVVAKRQLFGLRSVRREFPEREVTFQPDGTFTIHAEAIAK
jgi:hypothetical protein